MNKSSTILLSEIMTRRNWYKPLGIPRNLASEYKRNLYRGTLSHEKKAEILQSLGFEKVQEELWRKP